MNTLEKKTMNNHTMTMNTLRTQISPRKTPLFSNYTSNPGIHCCSCFFNDLKLLSLTFFFFNFLVVLQGFHGPGIVLIVVHGFLLSMVWSS